MTFWARRSPQCRDERSGGSVDKSPAPAEQAGETPEAEISDPFGRSVPIAEVACSMVGEDKAVADHVSMHRLDRTALTIVDYSVALQLTLLVVSSERPISIA